MRRTPSPPHPLGKRRGCLALGLPLCLLEEAGGGRPQVGSAWEAGVRQEPEPDSLRPFGPDAKDGQKQRAVGVQLAWAEPREVLQSIGPVSGTGFSAEGAGRGYQGVSRRHRVAESLTDPAPGYSHVCIPLPPSTPTSPALGFPSQRIPPLPHQPRSTEPRALGGVLSEPWCQLPSWAGNHRTTVRAFALLHALARHCKKTFCWQREAEQSWNFSKERSSANYGWKDMILHPHTTSPRS